MGKKNDRIAELERRVAALERYVEQGKAANHAAVMSMIERGDYEISKIRSTPLERLKRL